MTQGAYLTGLRAAEWAATITPAGGRVVVVGAGFAGLAAARRLTDDGVDTVVVEARDRIGGRVHPIVLVADVDEIGADRRPCDVDAGAGWLQHWDLNPLGRLAEALDLGVVVTDFRRPIERPRPPHQPSSNPAELLDDRIRAVTRSGDVSLAAALRGWIDALPDADRAGVRRALDADIDPESGACHDDLSALGAIDEPGVGNGDRMIVGGYRLLLDHLVGSGTGGRLTVRTSRPVTRVAYGATGVAVEGVWGAMTGDACIVTVPVGVLHSGAIRFEPRLAAVHQAALDRMGMGVVEKVLLRFAERWWPDVPGGCFRWFDDPVSWVEWADVSETCGAPVVAAFIAGDAISRHHTGRADIEIARSAAAAFARFVAAF